MLLVPMQELGSDDFDDRRCCERIAERMRSPDIYLTPADLSPGQLITAFGRSDMALNMRLHGMILAAMGRNPVRIHLLRPQSGSHGRRTPPRTLVSPR